MENRQSLPDWKMEPKAHPISLGNVYFTRSIVVAVPEHKQSEETSKLIPTNKIDISQLENDKQRFIATMKVHLNLEGNQNYPYIIDMECIGSFIVDTSLPLEEAQRAVTITANSVLYGAIREAVAWLTGRQPYGQLLLGLSILQAAPKKQDANAK